MAVKTVDHHNSVLRRASRRALELEPKLAALIEPVLRGAGVKAAAAFEEKAVDHLTASALWEADAARLAAEGTALSRSLVASLALRGAGDGVTALSTMIAVRPRQEEAERLEHVSEGSLPAEKLHVTLCYLGEYDGDLGAVGEVLHRVAAQNAPLAGEVAGLGAFKEGEDGRPNILLPSVPGLIELRVQVTEALEDAGIDFSRSYGYVPHMTVGYTDDPDLWPSMGDLGAELHFDDVWVVRGDQEFVQLPLVGVPPVTAAAGTPPWSAPAGDEIVDVDALVATLRTKTDPVRQAVVETTMKTTLDGAGIDFDVTNPFTAKVLAQAGSQVTNIARSTQLNVMKIVGKSYDEGLSIPDTAKAIRVGMADASVARSTLIARTELAGAVNGGSLAATQIVSDATGQGYNKQWLTAPGAQFPRHETYEGLDGQETVLEGFFQVGGDELQFPGDPAGSPEEVCNCRCAVAYVETGGGEVAEEDADNAGGFDPADLEGDVGAAADLSMAAEVTPADEQEAKDAWITDGSAINMALRGETDVADEMGLPANWKDTTSKIDSAMSPTQEAQNAWRGSAAWRESMGLPYGATPEQTVGMTFTDPAFTSVSTSWDGAEAFSDGKVMLDIHIPAGTPALDLTEANTQKELLLERNTTYRVTGVSEKNGYQVIHVDVVPLRPSARGAAEVFTDGPATKYLDQLQDSWGKTIDDQQRGALKEWQSMDGYQRINGFLRDGAGDASETVRSLDALIDSAPSIGRDVNTTVYRGVVDIRDAFGGKEPVVGQRVIDRGFQSVTTEQEIAVDYANAYLPDRGATSPALIKIDLSSEDKGVWLRSAGVEEKHASDWYAGNENHEMLLARNQEYVVKDVSVDRDGNSVVTLERVKVEPPVAPPVEPPPVVDPIEKIINPSEERPYAHWQKSTLDRQIIKSRSIVREAIAKDPTLMSLTDKERVLYERHKAKLEVLLKEKEFRAGQVARPFAHLADATLARKQVALRSQLRKIADLANPSEADLAVQRAASEQLRQITEERKYRKAHPDVEKASIAKAAPEAPVAPAGPQTPSQERMSRLKAVYASRSDAKDYQSFSRMHTAEWETQLSAAGNDFATEVEERMTARTVGQWRGHPESASVAAERRIVLNEVLSEIRPMGHAKADTDTVFKTTPNSKKLVPDAITAANWATKFYPTDWVNEAAKTTIKFVKADRGYFREGWGGARHELAVSGSKWAKEMTAGDPMYARVAVHELAHLMEASMPDIRRAESKFYERRTKGDALFRYRNGGKNEFVRRDEFLEEYMGKDYGQAWTSKVDGDASMMPDAGTSYEILSMGMESIFNNTNAVWTRDVDYRNFILGLLVGV